MGNVSLSIASICHAKNKSELETWFEDIIILEWEREKLDKYVGVVRIVKNALLSVETRQYFIGQWNYTRHGNYCIQQSYMHLGSYYILRSKYFQGA